MVRYDTGRLATSLASLRVPVMAIQTTYGNERRERRSMTAGQTTPYRDMLRANVPAIRIEIIPNTADRREGALECTAGQFPCYTAVTCGSRWYRGY